MQEALKTLESLDILRLMRLLPHRYPFILVDRIVDMKSDQSAIGIKNVTMNEPHFQGHFPGNPVMPGVLIVEAMAQTAGAISLHALNFERPYVVYFMTISRAAFRKPVVPGDCLELHVQNLQKRGMVSRFACQGIVAGKKVAEAEISAMISPAENSKESGFLC